MQHMHNLLRRQMKKYFGDSFAIPAEWQKFIEAINDAYIQSDIDRGMLERSLDLSSQELLQANSEMRALIQAFPDLLFRIDFSGKILEYRGGIADLYITPEKLVGKFIQSIPLKDISAKFQDAINRLNDTKTLVSIEYSLEKNENEYFFEARLLPLFENQIMVIIRNITDRKKAEQALSESEEKYRTLVENVNIGIYRNTGGPHGRFLQVNPAMFKIFGYDSIDELMNISVSNLYHNPNERILFVEEVSRNGFVKDKELLLKKKDGTPIWVSLTANAQYDENGDIIWIDGVLEDITERKKLEDQLIQAHKMEAIGTLAGGIAHDFNNILTAIMGYGSILKHMITEDDESRQYIDQILASSERAALLTRSLLAFSRKQIISPKPVDLNRIIKKIETILLRVIGEDIELKTDLSYEDLTVMADINQMEQVLMNLAANARDVMPDGGTLTIRTNHAELNNEFTKAYGYGTPGSYAIMSIEDTGYGMDEKTKERIFEPFFTTKVVGKGTGLGLAMVYGIINQHDGYINVYSELGKGTTFKIYLPLIKATVKEKEVALPSTPQTKGGTETILLAEDDSGVREITKKILEGAGYKVIEAVDGEDAVNTFMVNKDNFQLLILDVIMPKKSGKEVYEEIKKIKPNIRTLFISGYTADIIHGKGVLEEGLNFVSKPVSPDKLLKTVRDTLDK